MQGPSRESRQTIYYAVSYLVSMAWSPDKKRLLDFQKALLDRELEFSSITYGGRSCQLSRKEQSPLDVKLASVGPQVSTMAIWSELPLHGRELLCKEAEAICQAYYETWVERPCQILRRDATIRHLYSCGCHAFQFLWEKRLGQVEKDIEHLGGRPLLGGGLRLVLPAVEDHPEHIEVKIESFLQESEKMFIETLFVWPLPSILDNADKLAPKELLETVEKYATNEVCNFILKDDLED